MGAIYLFHFRAVLDIFARFPQISEWWLPGCLRPAGVAGQLWPAGVPGIQPGVQSESGIPGVQPGVQPGTQPWTQPGAQPGVQP